MCSWQKSQGVAQSYYEALTIEALYSVFVLFSDSGLLRVTSFSLLEKNSWQQEFLIFVIRSKTLLDFISLFKAATKLFSYELFVRVHYFAQHGLIRKMRLTSKFITSQAG